MISTLCCNDKMPEKPQKVMEYDFPQNVRDEKAKYMDDSDGLVKEVPKEVAMEIHSKTVVSHPLNPEFIGWDVHDEIFDEEKYSDRWAEVDYRDRCVVVYAEEVDD